MAKHSASKSKAGGPGKACLCTPPAPQNLKDRNLIGVNPLKEQFEPTEAMPMRQRARMAGAG